MSSAAVGSTRSWCYTRPVPKLSVAVITKNEATNIAAALESVTWADELVVVDSGSTDDTTVIARRYTERVSERPWEGYGAQKDHAAGLVSHDWILSVDADERVSPELAREIRQVLMTPPLHGGFRIPRVAYHLGRWIRSTDWYPDYQLRLYDRRVARWNRRVVHESVDVDGSVGVLTQELHHHAYRDLSHHLATIDRYTTLAAQEMAVNGQRAGLITLLGHPPVAFVRNYLLRGGYRDGGAGLVISLMNTYYVFLKFAKLWERQHRARHDD